MDTYKFTRNSLLVFLCLLVGLLAMFFNPIAKMDDTSSPIIETIAGGLGDGNLAVNLRLSNVSSFTVDNVGNIFLAQPALFNGDKEIIRRIDNQTKVINTIAGLGALGRDADTLALKSTLDIFDMKIDPLGKNLFISSRRKIDLINLETGNLTIYAGNGNPKTGNGDGTLATQASVFVDDFELDAMNNLFIYDSSARTIRRVDWQTRIIERVAGGGKIPLSKSIGQLATDIDFGRADVFFALDKSGNINFSTDNQVFRIDVQTKKVFPINFNKIGFESFKLKAISIDFNNNPIFIASLGSDQEKREAILKLDNQNNLIIISGNKKNNDFFSDNISSKDAGFFSLEEIFVDSQNNIYIKDSMFWGFDIGILRIDAQSGLVTLVAGGRKDNGDNGLAINAPLDGLSAVATDNVGNIFLSEILTNRVRRIDIATGIITTVAGNGKGDFSGDNNLATLATLNSPDGLVLDKQGNLFIADSENLRIRRVDAKTGIITSFIGNPNGIDISQMGLEERELDTVNIGRPTALAFSLDESILFISVGNDILKADLENKKISLLFQGGNERVYSALAFNKKNELLVSAVTAFCDDDEEPGSTLFRYNINTKSRAGITGGCFINALTVDSKNHIFISDPSCSEINLVNIDEKSFVKIAGSGENGYSGDGGPANQARISSSVNSLAVDRFGNIYFSDSASKAVRVIKGAASSIAIVIDKAEFQSQTVNITGKGFGKYGAKVFINGQDVSQQITLQKEKEIVLTGNRKQLNIVPGSNQVVVQIGVGKSNVSKVIF